MQKQARTVQRYIRLTELIPDLLDMVDEKKINFNSAVEISHLTPEEQQMVCETIESEGHTPSVAQAQEIKRLSQKKQLNEDTILPLFEKKEDVRTHQKQEPAYEQQKEKASAPFSVESTKAGKVISIPLDQFAKYMPNHTEEQITALLIKILDNWFHHTLLYPVTTCVCTARPPNSSVSGAVFSRRVAVKSLIFTHSGAYSRT